MINSLRLQDMSDMIDDSKLQSPGARVIGPLGYVVNLNRNFDTSNSLGFTRLVPLNAVIPAGGL